MSQINIRRGLKPMKRKGKILRRPKNKADIGEVLPDLYSAGKVWSPTEMVDKQEYVERIGNRIRLDKIKSGARLNDWFISAGKPKKVYGIAFTVGFWDSNKRRWGKDSYKIHMWVYNNNPPLASDLHFWGLDEETGWIINPLPCIPASLAKKSIDKLPVEFSEPKILTVNGVRDILRRDFKGNPHFTYADLCYYVIDKKLLMEFLRDDYTSSKKYVKEFFDCDDFSFQLMGMAHAYHKYLAGGAFFILWVKKGFYWRHAVNAVIIDTKDGYKAYVIEPQSDGVFEFPEDWKVSFTLG